MVLPAAVLFATVFTIGSLTRHSELTAAKASGISFYRLLLPIFGGAAIVMMFNFALGELVPITDIRRNELLEEGRYKPGNERYNFAYSAPHGRVYKIAALNVERRLIDNRRGRAARARPGLSDVSARGAHGELRHHAQGVDAQGRRAAHPSGLHAQRRDRVRQRARRAISRRRRSISRRRPKSGADGIPRAATIHHDRSSDRVRTRTRSRWSSRSRSRFPSRA